VQKAFLRASGAKTSLASSCS